MERERTAASEGKSVLLVEDKPELRRGTTALLERMGCRVTVVEDGFEALCRLGALRPGLIVMAAQLPRLDGFQACSLIKYSRHFRHIPVVLVADRDSLLEEARAELAGAEHFLVTPFRGRELQQILDSLASGDVHGRASREQA